jgi:hypothetical protein
VQFEFIWKIEKIPLQISALQTTLRQFVIYKKIKHKISIIDQRHDILGIGRLAIVLVPIKLNREKTGILQNKPTSTFCLSQSTTSKSMLD